MSSTRRPSLPTIRLQPSASTPIVYPAVTISAMPSADSYANLDLGVVGTDDLYSNLSSFTFGSVRPSRSEYLDLISPFAPAPGTSSADHTPRPSVSGPSSGASCQKPHAGSKSRTPRLRSRDIEDDGARADDEDEDEVQRQRRVKMRAMNDGSRRPSLPINTYAPERSGSPTKAGFPKGSQRSPAGASEDEHSEIDSESCITFGDGEGDGGDFDTDVEFDFHHNSITHALHDPEISDAASQHTFGGNFSPDAYSSGAASDDRIRTRDGDDDHGRSDSPVIFSQADHDAESTESAAIVAASSLQGRRGSLPWDKLDDAAGSGSNANRLREDSLVTVTGRGLSRSLHDEFATRPTELSDQVQVQQYRLRETDTSDSGASGSNAYEGWNLDYILKESRADETGLRRSWSSGAPSWMDVSAKASQQRASDKHLDPSTALEFSGWGFPVTGGAGRRPSAVTVGSFGEDAFTRHAQRFDPEYNERVADWSFKRELADGAGADVPAGARWVVSTGSARMVAHGTQEIWRQAYVGRFKVDKVLTRRKS